RLIQRGDADVMLAGGTEASLCEVGLASFNAIKALSTRNDQPEKASRPFDAGRDGFVPGEGAAVLVLESLEHAARRGAPVVGAGRSPARRPRRGGGGGAAGAAQSRGHPSDDQLRDARSQL